MDTDLSRGGKKCRSRTSLCSFEINVLRPCLSTPVTPRYIDNLQSLYRKNLPSSYPYPYLTTCIQFDGCALVLGHYNVQLSTCLGSQRAQHGSRHEAPAKLLVACCSDLFRTRTRRVMPQEREKCPPGCCFPRSSGVPPMGLQHCKRIGVCGNMMCVVSVEKPKTRVPAGPLGPSRGSRHTTKASILRHKAFSGKGSSELFASFWNGRLILANRSICWVLCLRTKLLKRVFRASQV